MTTLAASLTSPIAAMLDKPITQSSTPVKEEEKTIPFLRRLVDMLTENEDVISFSPGRVEGKKVTLGRIVVHDRLKVEAAVLPRYFNHSSFASLRRQLNYFSFTRLGKGRQRGATYSNEEVMDLDDILRLKRRAATSPSVAVPGKSTTPTSTAHDVEDGTRSRSLKRTPRVSISSMDEVNLLDAPSTKRARLSHPLLAANSHHHQAVSDSEDSASHDHHDEQHPEQLGRKHRRRITLDLTTPSSIENGGEDDVLAGCQALLSFARASGVH